MQDANLKMIRSKPEIGALREFDLLFLGYKTPSFDYGTIWTLDKARSIILAGFWIIME